VGRTQGISDEQFEQVAEFESSAAFDLREKTVMRLAEAMTATPATIPDLLYSELRNLFSEPEIVELAGAIALENFRARFNRVFEIDSQGYCALPSDHSVRKAGRHK
jgi:alkylhydroperoxidase family enzyme